MQELEDKILTSIFLLFINDSRGLRGESAFLEGRQMSTYVLMKIFERFPRSYDRGIRLLTFGKLEKAYERLILPIKRGDKVLDIGCGTGALTLRAARRGARVKGIDVNASMLEKARVRAEEADLAEKIEWAEMGVAEMGGEENDSFDVVMSGLCFSELSEDEFHFALREIRRILKPGGLLLIADEVRPENIFKRIIHCLFKFLFGTFVFILTATRTKSIKHLPESIQKAGFEVVSLRLNRGENFAEFVAKNPL